MKVYELMNALGALPANAQVLVSPGSSSAYVKLEFIDTDSCGPNEPILYGDDSEVIEKSDDD